MKPVHSNLIEHFLRHVIDYELIKAESDSTGGETLEAMTRALLDILDGADPTEALGIETEPGAPVDHSLDGLALGLYRARLMDDAKNRRYTWDNLPEYAKPYLESIGKKPLKRGAIIKLYNTRKSDFDRKLSIRRMFQKINKTGPTTDIEFLTAELRENAPLLLFEKNTCA